jgi:hypothetical protein
MLDWAVAALKSDEAKALQEFNDPDNKQFHLYVSCFDISDGKFIAAPKAMLGMDIRTFKSWRRPAWPKSLRCSPGHVGRKRRDNGL